MMIFKNVYIKIDKLKLMIRNDTIAFLFKFLDQIYLLGGVITNGKTEESHF